MGHRKSRGTAERSASRHGQHTHHHACFTAGHGRSHFDRRAAIRQRRHPQTAAPNPDRKRPPGGRHRARNCAVDQTGVTKKTMDTILFLAQTEEDGTLGKPALEALGAAVELNQALGGTLVAALYGAKAQPAADAIANCGAQRFLAVAGEDFASARYATDAAACEALIRASQATLVITAATSRSSRVMAGVTHRVGGCVDTHVSAIAADSGSVTLTRWFYRQRIEASLTRTQRPWVLLLDPGAHAAWQGQGASGPVTLELITVPVTESMKRTAALVTRSEEHTSE